VPRKYDTEAVEHCLSLYLKFNGQQHDRIEQEMRKKWPGWSKQNLYTRGKGDNLKVGWVEKYGWERALREHVASLGDKTRTVADQTLHEINTIRKSLFEQIKSLGTKIDRDLVWQHCRYTKLALEAQAKLQGRGHTLDDFVAMWELLLEWLPDISPSAARELLAVADRVVEKAAAEYGDEEDTDGGDSD
jgi:hypothetical protein